MTPAHVALPIKARDQVASTEIVAPIHQSEIYVFVPPSTAGQANGLVGALIDAGIDAYRAKTAETDVKPLRNAAVDLDFDGAFHDQLAAAMAGVPWMHVDKVRVIKEVASNTIDKTITGSKDAAVIIVNTDYHLSNDGADLYIVINVDLYANSPGLEPFKPSKADSAVSAPANSLYRNSFMFLAKAPDLNGNRASHIASWSANNGQAFRAAMTLGAKELAAMVASDIQREDADGPETAKAGHANTQFEVIGADADGQLERQPDGTVWYVAGAPGR